MNQIAVINLEKEINGCVYRLSLPMGAQWNDALEAIKQIHDACTALAQEAEKKFAEARKETESKQESDVQGE